MNSYAKTLKGKRSSEHFNYDEYISSDIEEEQEDELVVLFDHEFFQPPSQKRHLNKKIRGKKQSKVIAQVRQNAKQQEGDKDDNVSLRSGSNTVISRISENEVPKRSYVWCYFHHSEDLITSTYAVIMPDSKECEVYYKDSSTITNLINHLA